MVAVPTPWPSIELASPIGNSSSRMILQWSAGPSIDMVTVTWSLDASTDSIEIWVSSQVSCSCVSSESYNLQDSSSGIQ